MSEEFIYPQRRAGNEVPTVRMNPVVPRRKLRTGLAIALSGFFIFLLGARPSFYGLDRSPVIGFVQIAVFLVGLALICVGGYLSLIALWNGGPRSISADIGLRLVATGYVVAVFAGMADIFGFGSHLQARLAYFGPWQARGLEIGQAIIGLGFLLMLPRRKKMRDERVISPQSSVISEEHHATPQERFAETPSSKDVQSFPDQPVN